MPIYRGSQKVTPRRAGVDLASVYRGNTLVWAAQHALIRSEPDYWYSMENGAHWLNRGALDTPMRFDGGKFADRGDHAYTSGGRGSIRVEDSWAGGFTFAGWFEVMARDSTAYIFARSTDPAVSDTRRLFVISTGPTHHTSPNGVGVRIDPTGSHLSTWTYSPPNIIPESGWFHLAITWEINREGYPNWANIYVDGVPSGVVRWDSLVPPISFTSNELVAVGDSLATDSHRLHANVDDVAIWNRTLEPGEVAAIYRDGPVPTDTLEPVPPHREQVLTYSTAGTRNVDVPEWAIEMDYIVLGGGGGGNRGRSDIGTAGEGGLGGSYSSGTVPVEQGYIGVTVGAGGRGTTGGNHDHTAGGMSRIYQNARTLGQAEAAGGARGEGFAPPFDGRSPGNHSYEGLSITGGPEVGANTNGRPPGGGGGGGSGGFFGGFSVGRPGGQGRVVLRFRSTPR